MRIYYIRKIKSGPSFCRYEIYHKTRNKSEISFDGYAITKIGAKYRAIQLMLEDSIKDADKLRNLNQEDCHEQ